MSQVRWSTAKLTRLGIMLRVFVYEIDGLMIDTGPKSGWNQLKPFFDKIHIDQIALTHIHEDHSGNASWFSEKKNIPIYVHESSVASAQENGRYPFYRRMYWGPRKAFEANPIPEILETEHYSFKVIETPGHSADSITLYEEDEGILFTGDLYITQKPKLFLKEESIPKTIESLRKLIDLEAKVLYCSHSGKIENATEKLRGKLNYLLNLQEEILELHQKGLTKSQIMKRIFPSGSPIIFLSNNEFSYSRAIDSIINND